MNTGTPLDHKAPFLLACRLRSPQDPVAPPDGLSSLHVGVTGKQDVDLPEERNHQRLDKDEDEDRGGPSARDRLRVAIALPCLLPNNDRGDFSRQQTVFVQSDATPRGILRCGALHQGRDEEEGVVLQRGHGVAQPQTHVGHHLCGGKRASMSPAAESRRPPRRPHLVVPAPAGVQLPRGWADQFLRMHIIIILIITAATSSVIPTEPFILLKSVPKTD